MRAQTTSLRSLGQTIRAQRRSLRLTLEAVAASAGCAKGYLSEIENDRRESAPGEGLLGRLELALKMEAGSLVRLGEWANTPEGVRREVRELRRDQRAALDLVRVLREEGVDALHRSGKLERLVSRISPREGGNARLIPLPAQIPVVNKVAAGYPREFTDLGFPARVADEYVSAPDVRDPEAFAARVVGDSMSPRYVEGDIVVFSPERDTPEGSDCFVRLERDDETTFKRVFFEQDVRGREMIRLQPLNPEYPPRSVAREDVSGMYAAVYVIRAVGEGRGEVGMLAIGERAGRAGEARQGEGSRGGAPHPSLSPRGAGRGGGGEASSGSEQGVSTGGLRVLISQLKREERVAGR